MPATTTMSASEEDEMKAAPTTEAELASNDAENASKGSEFSKIPLTQSQSQQEPKKKGRRNAEAGGRRKKSISMQPDVENSDGGDLSPLQSHEAAATDAINSTAHEAKERRKSPGKPRRKSISMSMDDEVNDDTTATSSVAAPASPADEAPVEGVPAVFQPLVEIIGAAATLAIVEQCHEVETRRSETRWLMEKFNDQEQARCRFIEEGLAKEQDRIVGRVEEALATRLAAICGEWKSLLARHRATTERNDRALWAAEWLDPLGVDPALQEVLGEAGAKGIAAQALEVEHWRETEAEYQLALARLESEPEPTWATDADDRKEQGMRLLGEAFACIAKGDLAVRLYSWRQQTLTARNQATIKAKVLEERRGLLEELASQTKELRHVRHQLRNAKNAIGVPALQKLMKVFRTRFRQDLVEAWRVAAAEAGRVERRELRATLTAAKAKEEDLTATIRGLHGELLKLQKENLEAKEEHQDALRRSHANGPAIALLRRALHRKSKGKVSVLLNDWRYSAGEGALQAKLRDDSHQALVSHAITEAARLLLGAERAKVGQAQAEFLEARAEEAAAQARELEAELMSSGMFADDFETDAAKSKRRQDEDYARWATTQQTEALSKAQAQARLAQFKARLATDDAEAAKRHALQLGVAEVTLRGDMERQRLAPNPDEPTRAKSPMRKPDAAPSRKQLRRKSVVPDDSMTPATVEAPPVPQVDLKRLDVLARLGYVLRAQSQRAVAALCYLWRSHAQRATVEASRRRWEVEAQERQLELDRLQQDLEDHEAERAKP